MVAPKAIDGTHEHSDYPTVANLEEAFVLLQDDSS